jgi:hypothetical protein
MAKLTSIAGGLGIGAAMMYFLDPQRGGQRRALVRDQFQSGVRTKRQALDVMTLDVRNRMQGLRSEARARMSGGEVTDDVLVARVRSAIGHLVTHPRSIHVTADAGTVTLTGPVLANEVQGVVTCARRTLGVRHVENNLEVHDTSHGVPGLQGEGRVPDTDRWSPATAFGFGVLGSVMTLYGLSKRGPVGALMGLAGMAIVSKSFSDTERRFEPTRTHHEGNRQSAQQEVPPENENNELPVQAADASMM